MNSDVETLENEIKDYKLQLETVQGGLQTDPGNGDLQDLMRELEEVIALTKSAIAELKPAAAIVSPNEASPNPVKEKWSKENHPAYQAGYRKTENEPAAEDSQNAVAFKVNDTVLARWKSGDRSFYPAKITSITGSASRPVYIVTFENYATTETLSAIDIKLLSGDSKKRKADGMPGASLIPTPPDNPNVISAAANVYPSKAQQEPKNVGDGSRPLKVPRKVKAAKQLAEGQSRWQNFNTKGLKPRKESMFRTPEGVNARVGFTGSGQQMRKDPARSRHIYNQDNEDEV